MYMSEGVMTYPWSDFRRLLNRVTSIGPWICHNALRHIHGTTLFLKGKNDTCFFYPQIKLFVPSLNFVISVATHKERFTRNIHF